MVGLRHYRTEPVTDGVYAAIATDEGLALCNSGILSLGHERLVFDTSLSGAAAAELSATSTELTGQPPTIIANSHWHLDHVLGNRLFSTVPIYGTRRTREILLHRQAELLAELTAEGLGRDTRGLEERLQLARRDTERRDLERLLHLNRGLLGEAGAVRLVPPTHSFETRFRLPGDRAAELICFGSGHTDSDTVLHLPDDGILFAGDLILSKQHLTLASGDPEHWLVVLERLADLRPEHIVPGHGPVGTMEDLRAAREYLGACLEAAQVSGTPQIPERFAGWSWAINFEENVRFLRARSGVAGSSPA